MIVMALSFYDLYTTYFLYEEVMSDYMFKWNLIMLHTFAEPRRTMVWIPGFDLSFEFI